MEHDLVRDDYEKPRGIVVCDLHIKREQQMSELNAQHGKLLRQMNVLTFFNIGVCILSIITLFLAVAKPVTVAFGVSP